jgi:hypothetical protein
MIYLNVLKITQITLVFTGVFKISSYNRQKISQKYLPPFRRLSFSFHLYSEYNCL